MMTDSQCISRIADGNIRALDEVYRSMKPSFLVFFRSRFSMDQDSAMDLYQEAMAAMYNNIRTGRLGPDSLKGAKLSTYVLQVGKYIHLSHIRKRQVPLTFDTDFAMSLGDTLPDDEDKEKEDKLFIVRKTVETMPMPCSKLLDLQFFQEKSQKEIAVAMDYENSDSVKTQVYKCKKKLRDKIVERFKECGYDE